MRSASEVMLSLRHFKSIFLEEKVDLELWRKKWFYCSRKKSNLNFTKEWNVLIQNKIKFWFTSHRFESLQRVKNLDDFYQNSNLTEQSKYSFQKMNLVWFTGHNIWKNVMSWRWLVEVEDEVDWSCRLQVFVAKKPSK